MIAPSRFPNGVEQRAATEYRVSGRRLEGLAAPFDSPASIGRFVEVIKPGAFTRTLASGADVLALADHDLTRLLGRTSSGTLRLSEGARGLGFELDAPDTQLGHDILELARRGDLGGVSIAFRPTDETWPSTDRRELRGIDLVEISIIHAHPAYSQTSVTARGRGWTAAPDAASRRMFLGRL